MNEAQLPLAAPRAPQVFSDTVVRIAFIPDATPEQPVAMTLDFEGEDRVRADAKLAQGRMEISLTNGFNVTRTLQLSPAEYLLVLAYGDRFFKELPR